MPASTSSAPASTSQDQRSTCSRHPFPSWFGTLANMMTVYRLMNRNHLSPRTDSRTPRGGEGTQLQFRRLDEYVRQPFTAGNRSILLPDRPSDPKVTRTEAELRMSSHLDSILASLRR